MKVDPQILSVVISVLSVMVAISGAAITLFFAFAAQIFSYGKLIEKIKHIEDNQQSLAECQKDCSVKYVRHDELKSWQHKLCDHLNRLDGRFDDMNHQMIAMDEKRELGKIELTEISAIVKNIRERIENMQS